MHRVIFTAADQGHLKILKGLLDHLQEWEVSRFLLPCYKVNMLTQQVSMSALMLSCYNNERQEVVEYLLDKCPASIETTGSITIQGVMIEGVAPLWIAAFRGHLDIVKILVKRGANVNSKTKTSATPLHAACSYGHYEIVKYLVENNADIAVEYVNDDGDTYGMTPLMVASVTGHLHIVEHVISQRELVSKQERIDALELLGATFVDEREDLIGASKLWKRVIEERYEVPIIPKTTKKSPSAAYNNKLEVETVREVEEMSSEPDLMWMQALLVRERILGLEHPETWKKIRHRGKVYAELGNYDRCISLWMYAHNIQQKYVKPLDPITHTLLSDFSYLFCNIMTDAKLLENFSNIMMVFRQAVNDLRTGQGNLVARTNQIIVNVLCLVCSLTKLIPDLEKEKVYEIKQVVHCFVMIGAKGHRGASPLHLACATSKDTIEKIYNFPFLPTINLLLECGAPVDAKDDDGNTALHTAALNNPVEAGFIQSLLQNGAHFDLVNNQKKTFYYLLEDMPLHHEITNSAVHSRLACLAARVVRKQNMELDSLSLTLRDFVLKH